MSLLYELYDTWALTSTAKQKIGKYRVGREESELSVFANNKIVHRGDPSDL